MMKVDEQGRTVLQRLIEVLPEVAEVRYIVIQLLISVITRFIISFL